MDLDESLKAPRAVFEFECRDADGNLKWQEESKNLVTTGGMIALLNVMFGTWAKAAWYLGILDGTPAATDTLASHPGWTEIDYLDARTLLSFPATAGDSIAATGTITFNSTATFTGAFVTASSSFGAIGEYLYNATNFSATRTVASGDTLAYTITLSVS